MKKKKKESEVTYFVSIEDPSTLRRSLLEASRTTVHSLASYEKFKAVRKEKFESIQKLRSDLKQISSLLNKLKEHMPKIESAAPKARAAKRIAKRLPPMVITKHIKPKKDSSDLEKLESELDDIEKQLGSLK
ncbi:hypothetical protein ACFLZX_04195 [Nanoarchaeota archaeon]